MAEVDSGKYSSIPSNYVSIAQLQERWLKEKQRKQEEKENQEKEEKKQNPVRQNHQNRIANGPIDSRAPVGKNLHKRENHSAKGWRKVGLIANEAKSKEVKITASVVEEGFDGTRDKEKKKKGYFEKRKPWVERDGSGDMSKVSTIDVAEEEMMSVMSVENGGKESSKGKCQWNGENKEVEEVAAVCMVGVVGESNVDREIEGQRRRDGFRGKKNSRRRMGVRGGEASYKVDSVEQSGQEPNEQKEEVSVDVKERTNEKVRMGGTFRTYGDKIVEEVATVCTVEVVEENKVHSEITGQNCRVGFKGKKSSWRRMGDGVGQVSYKMDSGEQSGKQHNAEKEEVSVDVKERTNEKMRMRSAFCAYSDKEVEEVDTVCTEEVVGENKVDKEIAGQKCRVGFRGQRNNQRRMGDRVADVSNTMDSGEQSGKQHNAEKEEVSVVVKERTNEKARGAFCAYSDKEVEEVAPVCTVEVLGEKKVYREIKGQKCGVGFKGKKSSWRRMGDGVGQVSDKMDSGEHSGKQHNAEEEEVLVRVKERTNEKVRMRGAFCAYGDKEVEEVATVCTVEVVGENKVDKEIVWQKCRVGFRGKKNSWRRMGDGVGQVRDKTDSVEQSGQEHDAEKEEVSVDVNERTNEEVRVRGAFPAYGDKSIDVPLIDSEAGLKMKIERNLGDLSLSNRRYGHGRSSVGVYDYKWRCVSSRRYEPRKPLKQRDNSFVWVKKGESSNGNAAEIETQVDLSSQSTSRSNLCSQ